MRICSTIAGLAALMAFAFSTTAQGALIAHWTFDENTGLTAADSSTNGNTATTTADSWTTGVSGSGSSNPRYTLADSSDLNITGASAVSVSLWARTTNNHSFAILAGFEGTGSDGDIYGIKLENGYVRFTGPNTQYNTDTFQTISSGSWVHIVGVNDPGNNESRLYINGTEVATGALGNIPVRSTVQWTMGTYWNSGSYNFNGDLDDVQVYNQALSDSDVTFLNSNPGTAIPEPSNVLLLGLGGLLLARRRRS